MIKKIISFFLSTLVLKAAAQQQAYTTNNLFYTELKNPSVGNASDWEALEKDITVSYASSDIRYAKEAVPEIPVRTTWTTVAWRGEKVHAQILVWSRKSIQQLSYELSDFVNNKGDRIKAGHCKAGFVRYVMTDEFRNGCGYRKPQDFDSSLVADAIDIIPSIPVEANTVQPLWLSVQVPSNLQPGKYTGSITINADKKYILPIILHVSTHILPPARDWKFDLDLWQSPVAIARVHHVKLWSNDHYKLMRPYYTMLANAGQKKITASIIHEPWNHQTYDDYPSLIKWIKKKDGNWQYDYSLFDEYVSFVMSCGITQQINCYTMIPWELSFQYYDESLRKDTVLKAKPGSPEYNIFWGTMLKDFARHLKTKGWFNKTAISMDERPMKDMQSVIALLKSIDKDWKITMAGDYHPEIEKDIYDYCIASRWQFEEKTLAERKALGKPSTYYTCCTEPYPNGFTFSPPAEHVWIGWYAAAKGFDGYLRWAYNSWVKDPLLDSRFRAWPAGDTYQVYPGPRSSIRFEKLIEGIQDFEKLRVTREQLKKSGKTEALRKLEAMLASFEIIKLKDTPAAEMVAAAKSLLNQTN